MNRLLIGCCAILMAQCISAQTMVKEMDGADTRFIPGIYMKSGEAAIYFSSDEYGYNDGQTMYEAEIFDFELNPLKSFYFQILHPYTVTEQRATTGTKELTKEIIENRNIVIGMPSVSDMEARKSAFIEWYYNGNKYFDPTLTVEKLSSGCYVQGTTIFISLPIVKNSGTTRRKDIGYYKYEEYLKTHELFLDASDMYGFKYTYATEVPVCNGQWSTFTWYDVPVSNFCTPKYTDVARMNHWNGGVYMPFSQIFFNDDEKFEYVRYKAEIVEGYGSNTVADGDNDVLEMLFGITGNDRDGDGEEDYRQTRFGVKLSGLEVVSEDGTVIYEFPLPETCEGNARIEFFKSDNSILAQVDFNWVDENDKYMHTVRFYRMDKSAGVAQIIREENKMSVAPNPVSSGAPIKLSVPAGNKGERTLNVTSLNGTNVYSSRIEADVTSHSIPTHNLLGGMYVLTLSENGSVIGNCKIVVR